MHWMHTTPCCDVAMSNDRGKATYDSLCEASAQEQLEKSTYDQVSDSSHGQIRKKHTTPCVTCARQTKEEAG